MPSRATPWRPYQGDALTCSARSPESVGLPSGPIRPCARSMESTCVAGRMVTGEWDKIKAWKPITNSHMDQRMLPRPEANGHHLDINSTCIPKRVWHYCWLPTAQRDRWVKPNPPPNLGRRRLPIRRRWSCGPSTKRESSQVHCSTTETRRVNGGKTTVWEFTSPGS